MQTLRQQREAERYWAEMRAKQQELDALRREYEELSSCSTPQAGRAVPDVPVGTVGVHRTNRCPPNDGGTVTVPVPEASRPKEVPAQVPPAPGLEFLGREPPSGARVNRPAPVVAYLPENPHSRFV